MVGFMVALFALVLRASFGVVPPFGRMRLTEGGKEGCPPSERWDVGRDLSFLIQVLPLLFIHSHGGLEALVSRLPPFLLPFFFPFLLLRGAGRKTVYGGSTSVERKG